MKYKDKITELEKQGRYNDFVEDMNDFHYEKLDGKFEYKKNSWIIKFLGFLTRGLIVIFIPPFMKLRYGLKFEDKVNYKKIKKQTFIAISNHTQIMDCGIARCAVLSKRLYFTAAEINNKIGWKGNLLRALGMLPIGSSLSSQKKLDSRIKELKQKNCVIQFYPEQGMWPEYRRIRPFNRGAFHYAVKHNFPILPEFVYYRKKESEKKQSSKISVKYLEPIFPNEKLNQRQNILYMLDKAHWQYNQAYKSVYGKNDFIVKIKNPDLHLEDYFK